MVTALVLLAALAVGSAWLAWADRDHPPTEPVDQLHAVGTACITARTVLAIHDRELHPGPAAPRDGARALLAAGPARHCRPTGARARRANRVACGRRA